MKPDSIEAKKVIPIAPAGPEEELIWLCAAHEKI